MSNEKSIPSLPGGQAGTPAAAAGERGPPSAPQGDPPTFKQLLQRWLYRRFGIWGVVAVTFAGLVFFTWWNWDKLSTLPFVSRAVERLVQQSLPSAEPGKFIVAVARLQGDEKREYERLIVDALAEYDGVRVIRIDREVLQEGPVPDASVRAGHARAQEYMKRTGADVLVWGDVIRFGSQSTPRLYWTGNQELARRKQSGRYPPEDLTLPPVFWDDLADVLRLLALGQLSQLSDQQRRYVAGELPPFIAKVRELLERGEGQPGWSAEARASLHSVLGTSLGILGLQSGRTEPLVEAEAAYRAALEVWTRERHPQDWAKTQRNLGLALQILGEREGSMEQLKEAEAAYRAALEVQTRQSAPLEWASLQNQLGNLLQYLGKREGNTERLEEAEAAYRAALEVFTRERAPADWADLQNNLGNVLEQFGEQGGGRAPMYAAEAAFRAALEEEPRELVPLAWARTQSNLAGVLLNTGRLEEAVAAYRASLEETPRDRMPLDWAMTQSNLGLALVDLGRYEEAIAALRAALEERTRERVPLDWATTQRNLGDALQGLAGVEGSPARLEEAVAAYRAALEEQTREREFDGRRRTQQSLGDALWELARLQGSTARMEEAVAAYREAAALAENGSPARRENLEMTLGDALWDLGERTGRPALQCEAIERQLRVVKAYTDRADKFMADTLRRSVAEKVRDIQARSGRACAKRSGVPRASLRAHD